MAFRQIKAPAIANKAVIDSKLDQTAITGQTTAGSIGSLANDTLLIHDQVANALRKISVSNLVNSLTTDNLTEGANLYFTDARAQSAVANDISVAVATEKTRAEGAEETLQDNIDAEESARIGADSTLTANLASEVSRATSREDAIETAYLTADASLQDQIDNILTNTDPAALDSLAEIVTAFQSADDVFTATLNTIQDNLSAEITNRATADTNLQGSIDTTQAELDTTQTGAGLSADGTYAANTGANYISGASSLNSADVLLDSALKAMDSAYKAADTTHSNDIAALDTRVSTAEGEIDTLQADLSAEVTRSTDADAAFTTNLQNEIDARVIAVQGAKTYADTQDALLIGDVTVDGSVGNTITDRIATSLSSANAYTDIAEADAVSTSNAYTDSQIAALSGTSGSQLSDLAAEVDRIEAGAGLSDGGDYSSDSGSAHITTATSLFNADQLLNAAIVNETQARIDEDANLQGQIDNILSNTDPDALDSLTEIVAAFEAADAGLSGLISANQTAISNEAILRESEDTTLQGNIDSEAATRSAEDLILQGNIDAEESARIGADSAIQSELDATQSGAGLAPSGAYTANGTANYISAATSLKDADNKLDAALKTESDARISSDTAIQGSITTLAGRVTTNEGDIDTLETSLASEVSRAQGAESDLNTAIGDVQAELDATQVGAGLNVDGTYSANSSSNYITEAASLKDADNKLDTQIKTNANAIATETQARIDAVTGEASLRSAADSALQTNIDNEATARSSADTALSDRITANDGDIATLQAADTAEATTRANADTALQTELDATQVGAGLNADGTYTASSSANYIGTAESLKDADDKLDAQLKITDARVDAILNGSTEALDTFTEIVAAFESADSTLNGAITTLASDASNARSTIQAEVDRIETGAGLSDAGDYSADSGSAHITTATSLFNADQLLNAAIVNETQARIDADDAIDTFTGAGTTLSTTATTLAGAINELAGSLEGTASNVADEVNNIETAVGLDSDGNFVSYTGTNFIDSASTMAEVNSLLDSALKSEESARITAVSDEALARSNADTQIITDYEAADSALQTELDTTQTGAGLGADGAYTADGATNYISAATTLKDADKKLDAALKAADTAYKAADTTLQSNIDNEATTRANADTTLQSNIDTEATTRANADTNLQTQITANVTEVTATQYAAGLNTNGTYKGNSGTAYLDPASNLANADALLDAAIAAEVTRASGEESRIEGRLDTEITTRTNAVTSLTGSINTVAGNLSSEITRATDAETALQEQIDNILSNTDPDALDSLTEIVAAFQSADGNLTTLVANNATAISDEEARALAAELALQTSLNTEISNRETADTTLQSNIDTKVAKSGDTMSGVLNMGSNKITGLANGTEASDAVTKAQLDAVSGELGLDNFTTDDLTEGSNLYYTDERARAAISVIDTEGNGDISYNATTGEISADLSKSLLELTDMSETTYTGKGLYVIHVKEDETGIEFIDPADLDIFGNTYRQVLNGNNTQTVFSLDFLADDASTLVFVGGVIQDPTTHYTIDNTNQTITFTSAIPLGTQAVVIAREMVGVAPSIEDGSITRDKLSSDIKTPVASNNTPASTSGSTVGSFDGTVYRSAKYVIQVDNGAGEYETREALVIHDGTNAYITEYAILYTGASPLGDASVGMDGSQVNLVYTANNATTTVKVISTLIEI
jgi:hypothetical protein